ncbi:MAG: hypothetical protein WD897_01165 [Parcubacteria group bacterium]
MPRNIEDIIVPETKRSIRNIPIPEGRRKNNENTTQFTHKGYSSDIIPRPNPDMPREEFTPSRRNRKGVWIAAGVALLVLIFAGLSIFNGATLSYTPKSQAISFDSDIYTARKTGDGGLLYSVVKLSVDKGLEVSASGEEEVERKASGTIIIYNASTEEQRLRATTRFETPDGKIYQVPNAITIPGKSTVQGVEELGILEVRVHAEHPGEEFNIGLTDFTLPGLEGTSLFSSIYARSRTEMSGGFVGVEKVVSDQDMSQVKARLETALSEELTSEAKAQVPEDFILLPSLSSVTFENLSQTDSPSKSGVTINMRANLLGVMFKRSDLSNRLALDKINLLSGESVDINELDSLIFAFTDTLPADLLLLNEIKFSVTGEAVALWRTDEVALKADLVGKHKSDIPSILNNYPTVLSTTAAIWPFWKKTFPSDGARISIKKLPIR